MGEAKFNGVHMLRIRGKTHNNRKMNSDSNKEVESSSKGKKITFVRGAFYELTGRHKSKVK